MDKKVLIQDLADGLVLRRGLPKKDADVFVRSVFEIIGEYLQTDKIVKVKGLGTFKLVTVDSRESVDVNTGASQSTAERVCLLDDHTGGGAPEGYHQPSSGGSACSGGRGAKLTSG